MATCPDSLNGVSFTFGANVDRALHDDLMAAMQAIIRSDLAPAGETLTLHISSISEAGGHGRNSRHYAPPRKAIDISRVNGKRLSVFYPSDAFVTQVTQELQRRFDAFARRRENFGPFAMQKFGQPYGDEGLKEMHRSHMHFSITASDE